VAQQLDMGGMEKLLVEFARHADRQRFQLQFISMTSRGKLAHEIEKCGWPVTALEEPPGRRPGLVFRLARLFGSERYDLVHAHNTKALIFSAPAARFARVSGIIQTRHGQPYQATWRRKLMFRVASIMTDKVVCVSEDSKRLTAQNGVAPGKLCTLWNGVDIGHFRYSGPQAKGPVVTVARLSPEKDIENLVRAAGLIAANHPDFRLVIAGNGPCLPSLKELTSDLGMTKTIDFLGEVKDVRSLLEKASVFVLPSLTEGVSLTLLEAMAAGLPVVATNVGGNPEVVINGKTGILVPPGDFKELALAITALLCQPDLMRAMGREGRDRAERNFDVRKMVESYEDLYEEILCRKRVQLACS